MKKHIFTVILCLNGLLIYSQEKPVLRIKETTSNGKDIDHEPNYRVVDPNSILTIQLDREQLYSRMADTTAHKELTERLRKLRMMLEKEVEALQTLARAIEEFDKGQKTDLRWQQSLKKLAPYTNLILRDPQGMKAYTLVRGAGVDNINDQYALLFKAARLMVETLEDELKAELKANGSYVQLGAWIETKQGQRALHIPGFDDIAPQKPYQVAQFIYLLPEEQQQEMKAIAQLASVANREGLGAALNTRNAIRELLLSALDTKTAQNLQTLEASLSSILDRASQDLGGAKAALEKSQGELLLYNSFIEATVEKYKQPFSGASDAHLVEFNADVAELRTKTEQLYENLTSNAALVDQQLKTVKGGLQADVEKLSEDLKQLSRGFKEELGVAENRIRNAVEVLVHGEAFRTEAYQFSQEVKKMTLDRLPESGTLNLETSGERDLGDALVIRIAYGKGSSALRDLQTLRYRLYFCSAYVRTAVSFLFLDPVPLLERSDNKALFQYAPSYSILLKGIWKNRENSRKSLSYHTFFSPGLGLNISSLDFDGNGAMEIGMGGTFSIFQDFLQLGYGSNLFSGRGYSFFGLRIPVGGFAIR
ncbi:hypothetical protein [Pedobacter sp. SYSU D00535]|uniref:hypothetical protein n=1 Tax=Pedobacter sp. SYSU D00535 TaxID=2810308 RepID=UPI001A976D3E|nr:hypothetical protein [Pedobacter sp. SYSU D00535]